MRVTPRLILIGALGLTGAAGFGALGVWQVQRLVWKHELIARVESRIRAPPAGAPGPDAWGPTPTAEYRKIVVSGRFLHDHETLTQAVTEQGGGFWVMTPLRADAGFTVLVNRGFVPPGRRDPASRVAGSPSGRVSITGLLRLPEPHGGFLRHNDPDAGRWFSRDVVAIARKAGLGEVAPYFIDADATPNPGGFPLGGLTIVRFSDNHLVYAITWFALALMTAAATVFVVRSDVRGTPGPGAGRAG